MTQLKHPIREAERYIQNAKQILSEKADKEGAYYKDSKYVRMAGNTAWNGVLIALDAVLNIRSNMKKGQRPEFNDYQAAIAKIDRKMPNVLLNAYHLLHLSLGYDGITNYKIVQDSLAIANSILNWAEKHYQN